MPFNSHAYSGQIQCTYMFSGICTPQCPTEQSWTVPRQNIGMVTGKKRNHIFCRCTCHFQSTCNFKCYPLYIWLDSQSYWLRHFYAVEYLCGKRLTLFSNVWEPDLFSPPLLRKFPHATVIGSFFSVLYVFYTEVTKASRTDQRNVLDVKIIICHSEIMKYVTLQCLLARDCTSKVNNNHPSKLTYLEEFLVWRHHNFRTFKNSQNNVYKP